MNTIGHDEKINRFYISLTDAEQEQKRKYYFKIIKHYLN